MCRLEAGVVGEERGQSKRQVRENLEERESRMLTARAMVSRGRSARRRMEWRRGMEGGCREAEGGMRFMR